MKPLLALCLALVCGRVVAMSNYDDPRISTGFFDGDLPGGMDILKATLRADSLIEANIYLRDLQNLSNEQTAGYVFSLQQGGVYQNWLIRKEQIGFRAYRVDSMRSLPFSSSANEKQHLNLHLDNQITVVASRNRLTLRLPLDYVDYTKGLEYDVSSAEGISVETSFLVTEWKDNLSAERIQAKTINPLQLFSTLCTGRA